MAELAVAILLGVVLVIAVAWWRKRNFSNTDAPAIPPRPSERVAIKEAVKVLKQLPLPTDSATAMEALQVLKHLPADVTKLFGPELEAQFHAALELAETAPSLSGLRQNDPSFDEDAFLVGAQQKIVAIRNGERTTPDSPVIMPSFLSVLSVESSADFDRVVVRSREMLAGGRDGIPRLSDWTFVRSAAGRSVGVAGWALEGSWSTPSAAA